MLKPITLRYLEASETEETVHK